MTPTPIVPAMKPSASEADALAKIDAAMDMVRDLCKPRHTEGSREWIMSIPARPAWDPDIVIGSALRAARAVIAGFRRDPGWIACSERMPEMDALVWVEGGLARWRGGSRWDSQMRESFNRTIEWEVTHWMPLPPAPDDNDEAREGMTNG